MIFPLSYDVVIATCNRPEALALSIPLLIGQTRQPAKLIVVDSSDDHAATCRVVRAATEGWAGSVTVEPSPRGLTSQRNRGLAHVTAPVVFFPDDDSLFFPDAAEEIMAVYERDSSKSIAAVAGAERLDPPAALDPGVSWAISATHCRRARLRVHRNRLERYISMLKPAISLGKKLNGRHVVPDWIADMDVVPVAYMTGFRMTFRTEAIASAGFDETLPGYAVDEDIDASLTAMRSGLVVGARRAGVYHHRANSGRADARALSRMQVWNRAYVLQKHAGGPQGSPQLARRLRRRHLGFVTLKLLLGLANLHSASGRAAFWGTIEGIRRPSGYGAGPAMMRTVPRPQRP